MLLLHLIIASILTVSVRTLYVPSLIVRLYKNRDTGDNTQLSSPALQYPLNLRRNGLYQMMTATLRDTLLKDQLERGPIYFNGRRKGQYEMMWELLRESLLRDKNLAKAKAWLREATTAAAPAEPVPVAQNSMPGVVEKQLQQVLSTKTSALYDKPFLQKKGDREFLVLHPGDLDPFVSVIPNDIYYSIQKTCVNWLEDCNDQGMRAKLFRLVKSPF